MPVRFFQDKFKLGFESEQAGHPVYADVDFIEIATPGDLNTIIHRPATDKDKANYANLYAQYKSGLTPSEEGVPIEAWARLTPAQVGNYKAKGFGTVEHIAQMSDQIVGTMGMGAQGDKVAAQAYLTLAKDSALAQKQALEIDRQNQTIADLTRQVKELAARVENQGGAGNEALGGKSRKAA